MKQYGKSFFILLLTFGTYSMYGQNTETKRPRGHLYFSWGYNKDWYSKSDLHFASKSNNDFDFTVYAVKAHDNPSFNKVFVSDISVPQFIYRVGYTFARHPEMGIEIGFDHAKYIMSQDQLVHIKGKLHDIYVDNDTILRRNFLRFEHTNGANFLMVSFIYRKSLYHNSSGKSEIFTTLKPGAGIVIPQSEVGLFGVDQNNNYHIAGYVTGLDLDLRYEFNKRFIFETGFKGVFANYLDVLSIADSRANHHFFALEWLISIGYQIPI